MKHFLMALLLVVLSVLIPGEFLARYLAFSSEEREQGVQAIWDSYKNEFVFGDGQNKCSFTEKLTPHPYLGFVNRQSGECAPSRVNNRGFVSKYDMPIERDPNFFSILVLGGSVASQLAAGNRHGKIWLEEILNENYVSPNGKPFRVITGAMGGWAMPTQVVAASLFENGFDGIISIDGYNESLSATRGEPIDKPNGVAYLQPLQPLWALGSLSTIVLLQKWRRFQSSAPLLSNSFFGLFLWLKILNSIDPSRQRSTYERTVGRFFSVSGTQAIETWNKNRYKHFMRVLSSMTATFGISYAHFLQPIPLLEKKLTGEERAVKPLTSAAIYKSVFFEAVLEAKKEGIPAASLIDVFRNEKQAIYGDAIHCKFVDGDSYGYQLMSRRIANELETLWKLEKRSPLGGGA